MTDFFHAVETVLNIIVNHGIVGVLVLLIIAMIFVFYKLSTFVFQKFEDVAVRHEKEMAEFRKYMTEKNGHLQVVTNKVTQSFDASVSKLSVSLENLSNKFENLDKEAAVRNATLLSGMENIKDVLLKK